MNCYDPTNLLRSTRKWKDSDEKNRPNKEVWNRPTNAHNEEKEIGD